MSAPALVQPVSCTYRGASLCFLRPCDCKGSAVSAQSSKLDRQPTLQTDGLVCRCTGSECRRRSLEPEAAATAHSCPVSAQGRAGPGRCEQASRQQGGSPPRRRRPRSIRIAQIASIHPARQVHVAAQGHGTAPGAAAGARVGGKPVAVALARARAGPGWSAQPPGAREIVCRCGDASICRCIRRLHACIRRFDASCRRVARAGPPPPSSGADMRHLAIGVCGPLSAAAFATLQAGCDCFDLKTQAVRHALAVRMLGIC